ncbi:polysaccharide deacetylase family protein [Novosphingobium sp. 9]|uniref:polysaccharide deacetylase family protein n=1 Tax=Novosphingobium sp. 9 TaxID=2025349 RepID=UPI0021B55D4F|nr:polysaccharide deacetylase family protein [Novosphingobium sp. 9]
MSLDPAYLEYSHRRQGYDHDFYDWSALRERPAFAWPGGKPLAVWLAVSLEWFPIVPEDKPFRAPGHMQTAYPDYRHYTSREYGSRVGVFRMLDAFAKVGARASFLLNAAIAERYPELVASVIAAGHEIVAHSTDMNGTIASTLPEEQERALIRETLDRIEDACGVRPRGWASIARSQSFATPRLLAEAGVEYQCDWVNDELPYAMQTSAGQIVNIPLNHELSDRQIVTVQQHSAESYAEQIGDAAQWLADEAARENGARMLPLQLTPYIMGLPYRIGALEDLLAKLAAREDVWFATGANLLDGWRNR